MKADKREIVTFVIAALATLVAVWFFLGKMQKEKDTVRTDLYTLVAPASDAILSVNRPAAFTKYILSRDSERMLSPRRFRISTFPSSKTTGISRGYFYLSIHRELSFMHKRETTSSAG